MKKIPIGIKNYRKLKTENYYTVDKSLMIQEFLNNGNEVTLVTRPRRFGKTINMSMMAEFFDVTKKAEAIFQDTAIMKTRYATCINTYPTIFLTFAEAKETKENIIYQIKDQLMKVYNQYAHVLDGLKGFDIARYERISKSLVNDEENSLMKLANAISFLMEKCHQYYGKKVMLFIDEYDTPFVEAHIRGFYEEIRGGLAALLRSALKTSNDLQYALLTGIQRVAKENVFSDLNNLLVCMVKDKEYAQSFGFTKDEVTEMLEYYGLEYSKDVKQMYDGYNMGGTSIYNPWSLINYLSRKKLRPYWVNTSSNMMLKKAMQDCDDSFKNGYEELICTGKVKTLVNFETSFYEVKETSSLWGLFVNAGYLTIKETIDEWNDTYVLRIPNQEIMKEFHSLTSHYLHVEENTLVHMFYALENQNWEQFHKIYQKVLLEITSYFDLVNENSYHTLLLGMCAWLYNIYDISSNKEQGKGRYDILLKSKKSDTPSLLFELKYTKNEKQDLTVLAEEGLKQAKEKKYSAGIENCIVICLAHHGKQVAMRYEIN